MLYPLKFKPRFLEKIWGGRKLQSVLGKALPPDSLIGESWEFYDFPPGSMEQSGGWVSSEIANGPLAGRTLHSIIAEFGRSVYGNVPLIGPGQFPLLIKFLDARENLSVQVHPDVRYAAEHPGASAKAEAWYVVQNDAGARLYRGLRAGVSKERLETALAAGTVEDCVEQFTVKPGDCFYLPGGTVHALGAGILVAEVQTPSDTTYRLFDFGRLDPASGKPRQLHVAEALACIDFGKKREARTPRSHVAGIFTTVTRLVSSPYFTLEKVRFAQGVEQAIPYDQPVVWIMLEGEAQVKVADIGEAVSLRKGDTTLLPAEMREPIVKTIDDCVWLEVTFPSGGQHP